jgi:cytoskeleton protein RodZ
LADVEQTLGKTVRPPPPRSETGAGFSRPLLIAILLLVIGAAALFWLPQPLLDRIGDSVARLMQREAPEAPAIEAPMAESPPPAAQAEPAAAAITTEPVAAAPPAPVEPAPVEPAAAPEPASAPVAPVPPTDAGGDLIVFTARGDAWISVTGSNDGKLLERVVKAGETVGLNGTGTLSVTVGRASGVDVQVRGKPFDMTRLMSPGGVARFEVRPE